MMRKNNILVIILMRFKNSRNSKNQPCCIDKSTYHKIFLWILLPNFEVIKSFLNFITSIQCCINIGTLHLYVYMVARNLPFKYGLGTFCITTPIKQLRKATRKIVYGCMLTFQIALKILKFRSLFQRLVFTLLVMQHIINIIIYSVSQYNYWNNC